MCQGVPNRRDTLTYKKRTLIIVLDNNDFARRGEWHSPMENIHPSRFNLKMIYFIKGRMPYALTVAVAGTMIKAEKGLFAVGQGARSVP